MGVVYRARQISVNRPVALKINLVATAKLLFQTGNWRLITRCPCSCQAVSTGYRNANAMTTESALDPLRNRTDFQLLMLDLVFPAEPFAKGSDQ